MIHQTEFRRSLNAPTNLKSLWLGSRRLVISYPKKSKRQARAVVRRAQEERIAHFPEKSRVSVDLVQARKYLEITYHVEDHEPDKNDAGDRHDDLLPNHCSPEGDNGIVGDDAGVAIAAPWRWAAGFGSSPARARYKNERFELLFQRNGP